MKFRVYDNEKGEYSRSRFCITDRGNLLIFSNGSYGRPTRIDDFVVEYLRYERDGVEYYDGDVYRLAEHGEDTVNDFGFIQEAIMSGESDDIGQILRTIHDKEK